ncbi:MAG: asparaginase [Polyangiales bacterium]
MTEASGARGELATDGCKEGADLRAAPSPPSRAVGPESPRRCATTTHGSDASAARWRHPELTSGTGRTDLDVVRHVREPVAVKIGAQGLFCLAFPERGLGVALKVHSGSGDALPAATSAVLSHVMGDAWGEARRLGAPRRAQRRRAFRGAGTSSSRTERPIAS